MSKWFLVIVLAVGLVAVGAFGFAPKASANDGPHGGYLPDTGKCAGCHRAHTAVGEMLLKEGTITDLCLSCHDGTFTTQTNVKDGASDGDRLAGGGYNKSWRGIPTVAGADWYKCPNSGETGCDDASYATHGVGEIGTAWGGASSGTGVQGALECTSCHNPHGSTNFRILRDSHNGYPYDNPAVHRWVPGGGVEGETDSDPATDTCSDEIDNSVPPDGLVDGDDPGCLPESCWDTVDNDDDGNTDAADADCEAGSELLDWADYQVVPVPISAEHEYSPYNTSPDPDEDTPSAANYSGLVLMGSGYGAEPVTSLGISAWCATCHKQYLTKSGSYEVPSSGDPESAAHYVYPGTQDALDGNGDVARYRHAVLHDHGSPERPLRRAAVGVISTDEAGDAEGDPTECQDGLDNDQDGDTDLDDSDCAVDFGELPDYGAMTCLTCHFAHGSAARNNTYGGAVAPTNDNALLYYDNRGVCRSCHQRDK